MALIDLSTYKSLLGVDTTDTRDDAQITALLDAASKAVETYAGRDFDQTNGVATERIFQYDGSGFLDIDDCTSVTSVKVYTPNVADYTMDATEWTAMPGTSLSPVFYYLLLHGGPYIFSISPEMGFERNLDQYPPSRFKSSTIGVTATWGWPAIPSDVKLATALTIQHFVGTRGATEGLTAEAIEGWSRSWGRTGAAITGLAIPNKARDLLAAYQRVFV